MDRSPLARAIRTAAYRLAGHHRPTTSSPLSVQRRHRSSRILHQGGRSTTFSMRSLGISRGRGPGIPPPAIASRCPHGTGRVSFIDHADKPFRHRRHPCTDGNAGRSSRSRGGGGEPRGHHRHSRGLASGAPAPRASAESRTSPGSRSHTGRRHGLSGRHALARPGADDAACTQHLSRRAVDGRSPGSRLVELWSLVSTADRALMAVTALRGGGRPLGDDDVAPREPAGERRRDRRCSVPLGARPAQIFGLLLFEAGLLASAGAIRRSRNRVTCCWGSWVNPCSVLDSAST